MRWFTADTHFHHKKIILYCEARAAFRRLDGRQDTEAMDAALIRNWNSVVWPDDEVIHLGDFSFAPPKPYLDALNGKKILVMGNHDPEPSKCLKAGFSEVHYQFVSDGMFYVHSPYAAGAIHPAEDEYPPLVVPPNGLKMVVHGHVHEKWVDRTVNGIRYVNVGVDVRHLCPVSLEEISRTA